MPAANLIIDRKQTELTEWKCRVLDEKNRSFGNINRRTNYLSRLKRFSDSIDAILREIWAAHLKDTDAALVAVGGYGRAALFPFSDVDIMVLVNTHDDDNQAEKITKFVSVLWDIGLDVGHSVRNSDECVKESLADVSIQTNLLESRLICGNRSLFTSFQRSYRDHLNTRTFTEKKIAERKSRHNRYSDSFQNLEPNLKESPGGLRDLQNILWIAGAAKLGNNWAELVQSDVLTQTEAKQIEKHERALTQIRVLLHLAANRKEDRLLFEYQNKLAATLGLTTSSGKRASEKLMQIVYRSAKSVNLLTTLLEQNILALISGESDDNPRALNEYFQARNEFIELKPHCSFRKNPEAILTLFSTLQSNQNLKGVSTPTLRALWHAKRLITEEFRQNTTNKTTFINFFKNGVGLTHILRWMHQYEILGRYLPEFGHISGQMQHDLFHVYTVDDHILMVVRNLRRFAVPEMSHEYPLCSRLISAFDKPELIYIAGLYHDIAKGRGGDHSIDGMRDAEDFCDRHGLTKSDTNLVVWLVERHLYMSTVAQKKDISDPAVIDEFANIVQNKRRLIALYILTVADIRGTSPKIWNAWKAKLLEDLFHLTLARLEDSTDSSNSSVEAKKQNAEVRLLAYAIPKNAHLTLWKSFNDSYFIRHDESEVVWHARVLNYRVLTKDVIVKTRLSPIGEVLQVMVYGADAPRTFEKICGFFDQTQFSVVEAKLFTTNQNYFLDTFQILTTNPIDIDYRDIIRYVEHELPLFMALKELPPPSTSRLSRRLKFFPISPTITVRPDEHNKFHYLNITCADQPGLLYQISRVLSSFSINVLNAKINTLGERAEDSFLIEGDALANENSLISLQTALKDAVEI